MHSESSRIYPFRFRVGVSGFGINHGNAVHINNFEEIAYHQNEVLYIIIAKEKYSLRLMIYAYGDDIHAGA